MARPTGDFQKNKIKLYEMIKSIAGLDACETGNAYFAKCLDRSSGQINLYLKALKAEGLIVVETSSPLVNQKQFKFFRKRKIYPSYNVRVLPKVEPKYSADELTMKASFEAMQRTAESKKQVETELYALEAFDRDAVLKEMQAELALEGVQMEI